MESVNIMVQALADRTNPPVFSLKYCLNTNKVATFMIKLFFGIFSLFKGRIKVYLHQIDIVYTL